MSEYRSYPRPAHGRSGSTSWRLWAPAAILAAAVGLALSTNGMDADEPATPKKQTIRYVAYVPNWDFPDEASVQQFGEALSNAIADDVAKRSASMFPTSTNVREGGCIVRPNLPPDLLRRVGRCVVVGMPILPAQGFDPPESKSRGALGESVSSGCLYWDVTIDVTELTKASRGFRELPRDLENAANRVYDRVADATRAGVNAFKASICRGLPVGETSLPKTRGVTLGSAIPVTIGHPVVHVW